MPTTRKSGGGRGPATTGKQSTLSFSHRVTKSVPKSAKDASIPAKKVEPIKPDVEEVTAIEAEAAASPIEETPAAVAVPEKGEAEVRAQKVSKAAIERYWRDVEDQRMAKRVHQESLTTGEKVLRYFDVSSQYGPCIGITRMKRWQRAHRLGLNPPIEVLAVLVKEDSKDKNSERAHMDEIMNATAISA